MPKRKLAYQPDKFKPLMPPPPPIHHDPRIDRANMRRYAMERYITSTRIHIHD